MILDSSFKKEKDLNRVCIMESLELELQVLNQSRARWHRNSTNPLYLAVFSTPHGLLWAESFVLPKSLMRKKGCPHFVSLSDVSSASSRQLPVMEQPLGSGRPPLLAWTNEDVPAIIWKSNFLKGLASLEGNWILALITKKKGRK